MGDLKPGQYPDPAEAWETLTNHRDVERAYQAFLRDRERKKFKYLENGKEYWFEFDRAVKDDGTQHPEVNKKLCLLSTRWLKNPLPGNPNNLSYRAVRRRWI